MNVSFQRCHYSISETPVFSYGSFAAKAGPIIIRMGYSFQVRAKECMYMVLDRHPKVRVPGIINAKL